MEKTDSLSATSGKSLISASTISNLDASARELVYASGAIITPLAREQAKKRGIKLIPKD